MSIKYTDEFVIKPSDNLDGEKIINQDHLYNIVHSRMMDCNPHTKVKYSMETISKKIGKSFVIFVPSSAKNPIIIPPEEKDIILDIRSLDISGRDVLTVLGPLLSDFSIKCTSKIKSGTTYLTPSNVTDQPIAERPQCPMKDKKVTILVDRYTLCELDQYCTTVLAYFYKHYNVNGIPHKMYKYIFRTIVVGTDKKYKFAIPVIKLSY